jgi:Spy/CpxP family protein refolding chaperone
MTRLPCFVLVLALGLLLTAGAGAQEPPKAPLPPIPPGVNPLPGGPQRPLLPKALAEKLDLTEEQKAKIEKVEKEYADKQKEAFDKVRELMKKGDPEAMRKVEGQLRDLMMGTGKPHQEAEAKLKEVLTKEQQKKYDELKKDYQVPGPGAFPGGFPPPGGLGPPGGAFPPPMNFRPFPGQVVPPHIQEMLKLTPEQKEKLEKIQKEAEGKVMDVLTDEQKKQVEEMKKRFEDLRKRPPAPPGGAPPAPPGAPPG